MSLIELIIAAAVLLIAITGLFGTLYAATSMSVQAKQQNTAVNVASSYTEMVRALPYGSIGLQGAASPDPTGTLVPTSTITVGGFSVVIAPKVTWVADPRIASGTGQDYKQLDVTVSVSPPSGGRVYSQRFVTFIRRPDTLQAGGASGGGSPPTITFVAGSKFLDPSPVYVTGTSEVVDALAQVASGSSATLKNVEFRCDGTLLYGSGTGGVAEASWINTGGTTQAFTFTWNTAAVDASGTVLFPDGQRVLRILAWDTAGGYRYRDTTVIVDNHPPSLLLSPPVLVKRDSATLSTIGWGASTDGPSEWANHYVVHLWRESAGFFSADLGDTETNSPPTLGTNPTTNSCMLPTAALSRYWVKVDPHSGMHKTPGLTNMVVPFITRPTLDVVGTPSVTSSKSGNITTWTGKTNMSWPTPTFNQSSVVYELARCASPDFASGVTSLGTWTGTSTLSHEDSYATTTSGTYYYRLRCTTVPTGQYANGDSYTVYSNLVAVTIVPKQGNTPDTISTVYDWTRNTTP